MKKKSSLSVGFFTTVDSPLGCLTLAADGERLCGLWIDGQKYFGGGMIGEARRQDDLAVFLLTRRWLDRYFSGEQPSPGEIPIRFVGSVYRRAVWRLLLEIPYGRVTTYGAISAALNSSPRAVGGAVGHNPISIVVPCHRVVGGDGALTGYAGGVTAKSKLLGLEGALSPKERMIFFEPAGISGENAGDISPRL